MPKESASEKFGVEPVLIPDFLALVGDAADGYPGIAGIGAITAARLLNKHGMIEKAPAAALLATAASLRYCSNVLATLRADARLFRDVDELRWRGPTDAFAAWGGSAWATPVYCIAVMRHKTNSMTDRAESRA